MSPTSAQLVAAAKGVELGLQRPGDGAMAGSHTHGGDAGPGLGNGLETLRPFVWHFRHLAYVQAKGTRRGRFSEQAGSLTNGTTAEGTGLNGEQEPEEAGGAGGGLLAPPASWSTTDGAACGARWEARKFPPDVSPLPVKWEAGSCREGGKQRRRGKFPEGEQLGGQAPAPSLWPRSAREWPQ